MDRYGGYVYKSYTAYTGVKPAPVFGEWSYPNGGLEPHPNERVRKSFVHDSARGAIPSDGHSDRSKGSLHPLPHNSGKDSNLTGKTMVVDMAYPPYPSKNGSPTKVDQPTKHYEESMKVHDERNQLPNKSDAPSYGHPPPYSTGGHGEPTSNTGRPVHSPNFNGHANPGASNSYGKKDWQPTGNMTKNDIYDDHYRRNDNIREPTPMNNGGWTSPRHAAWEAPPNHGAQLGEQMYHIDKLGMDSHKEPTKHKSTTAQSAYPDGRNGHGGYGYYDYDHEEGNKSTGASNWNGNNGEYYQKKVGATTVESGTDSRGGFNGATWTPSPRNGTQLSQTTNDIDKVIGMLKEAANPTSGASSLPKSRYTIPISTAPNKDAYPDTTHNINVGRRYGNFKFSSQPR